MNTVTVVILHRGDQRLPHIMHVLAAFRRQDYQHKITVVEQDSEPYARPYLEPLVDQYIYTYSNGQFARAWGMNCGVVATDTSHVLLHDSDLVPPTNYISEALRIIADADGASPWYITNYLSEATSMGYPGAPREVLYQLDNHFNKGASNIIRRDWYLEYKGMDERFVGWGAEDDAFYAKMYKLGAYARAAEPSDPSLDHLWHSQDNRDHPNYYRNLKMLREEYDTTDNIMNIINNASPIGNIYRYKLSRLDSMAAGFIAPTKLL